MPRFRIRCHEDVASSYVVEADSEQQARRKLDERDPQIDWNGVEQEDYMAFSRAIRSVEEIPS